MFSDIAFNYFLVRLPKFKAEVKNMLIEFLPSRISVYISNVGENPCWSDWSSVFLSKGGSKENPCSSIDLSNNSRHGVTTLDVRFTAVDQDQYMERLDSNLNPQLR